MVESNGSMSQTVPTGVIEADLYLNRFFSPSTAATFLTQYFGKALFYAPGAEGRFEYLMPWAALNEILRHHRLPATQLKVVKSSSVADATSYTHRANRQPADLAPAPFGELLRHGSTLIVDNVDEIYEPVTELTDRLARALDCDVRGNLYAAWQCPAFGTHYDDHDTLIVQVAGRKHWKVWEPTLKYPIHKYTPDSVVAPTTPPTWEGMLTSGDLLYLPRGWWHEVTAIGEPTLHITLGVYAPTAVDLVHWLADQLKVVERCRMDIPRQSDTTRKAEHERAIRDAVLHVIESPSLFDDFLTSWDLDASPRRAFGLPWMAMENVVPELDATVIRVLARRRWKLRQSQNGSSVEIWTSGQRFEFDILTLPLLEFLNCSYRSTIGAFMERFEGDLGNRDQLRRFLGELAKVGLIAFSSELRSAF